MVAEPVAGWADEEGGCDEGGRAKAASGYWRWPDTIDDGLQWERERGAVGEQQMLEEREGMMVVVAVCVTMVAAVCGQWPTSTEWRQTGVERQREVKERET